MPFLKRLWAGWKRVAHKIARINSLVLTTVLYYLLLPCVAIPFRLAKDPLRLKEEAGFLPRSAAKPSLQDAGRQG
ncbi:MAG: hypothetical protein HYZ11_00470 [Candidatus Tectomicrobia bacterium]|uniref:Uncharacterized protein n=1 Tax=Tectimicrobiota bacterium TaxID=2528274 RepID=A0A932HXM7_UNCTE|nr:hypothetical protein [Candidatus Tectomicrobia bacterium]